MQGCVDIVSLCGLVVFEYLLRLAGLVQVSQVVIGDWRSGAAVLRQGQQGRSRRQGAATT